MKKPPCYKDCARRHPACHDSCDDYRQWKAEHDAIMVRKRNEEMLDGRSDWAGYSELYWDKPANEARRREGWRARKQDETRRRKKRDELRAIGECGGETPSTTGNGACEGSVWTGERGR